jgi:hypothetical protein
LTKIAFGPYEPDLSTSGSVKNVLPRKDGYGPLPSVSTVGTALPSGCRGYKSGFSQAGVPYLIAGTATKLYRFNNTTLAWDDVSTGGGSYSLQATDFWSFDQFGDNLIAAAGSNVDVQTFTLSSGSTFAALAGSPPRAKHVAVVGDFVVLSGIAGHYGRIQWSAINNSASWTPNPSVTLADFQDFPDGGDTHGVAGGEFGLVFQDTAIRQMNFVAGSPEIFQFTRISADRGISQPLSLARVQTASFFLGSDGFYRAEAGSVPTPIGNNRVNITFIADADLSSPLNMVGAADVNSSRVVWAYRSRNASASARLDKLLIYDWALDQFSYGEVGLEWIASASQPALTLEGLDAISSSLDTLPAPLDSYVPNALPTFSAFTNAHKFGFWRGVPLEATMTTPENSIGQGVRTFVRGISPIGDAITVVGSVISRERLMDVTRQTNEAALNVRGYCPLRTSGRYHSAQVRVPAGSAWSYMSGVDADITKVGAR